MHRQETDRRASHRHEVMKKGCQLCGVVHPGNQLYFERYKVTDNQRTLHKNIHRSELPKIRKITLGGAVSEGKSMTVRTADALKMPSRTLTPSSSSSPDSHKSFPGNPMDATLGVR